MKVVKVIFITIFLLAMVTLAFEPAFAQAPPKWGVGMANDHREFWHPIGSTPQDNKGINAQESWKNGSKMAEPYKNGHTIYQSNPAGTVTHSSYHFNKNESGDHLQGNYVSNPGIGGDYEEFDLF